MDVGEEGGGRTRRRCTQLQESKQATRQSTKKRKISNVKATTDDTEDIPDNNDWICSYCNLSESFDGSDLVLCDGPCLRSFHMGCLDQRPDLLEQVNQDKWFCDECKKGRHSCFVCGIEGEDHKDVKKCMLGRCGKYYHWNCLQGYTYRVVSGRRTLPAPVPGATDVITPSSKKQRGRTKVNVAKAEPAVAVSLTTEEDEEEDGIPNFRCPRHYCETCSAEYEQSSKGGVLYPCVRCPRTFHLNCIPLSARTSTLAMMCARHPFDRMPDRDASGTHEETVGLAGSFFAQLQIPDAALASKANSLYGTQFLLPTELREVVANHEPDYSLIWKLDYSSLLPSTGGTEPSAAALRERMPPVNVPTEECSCTGEECDDKCLNRMLCIECFGGKTVKDKEKEKEGKEIKERGKGVCNVGGNCGNRQFTNKEYVQLQTFREPGMGWGAKTVNVVSKGALVIEYIGEVIDTKEMQRRMEDQRRLTPGDHDFYIMELCPGYYVDGKHKGSASRFINHSCDPNCELMRWNVKGLTRIGIFAIRDIAAGEPLSYDYQFDTKEENIFACRCGSANCRGTMAPKKKEEEQEIDVNNISKSQKSKLIAAAKAKEKKNAEIRVVEEQSRSLTGRTVPGDSQYEIRSGPIRHGFQLARARHVFLPRNAVKGNNFLRRFALLEKRAMKLKRKSEISK